MRLLSLSLRFDNLRGDVFGGLTAAVVALPLALAFGVASGVGPIAGLYGAIALGFFAALFGGTPAQVSGPTGPMTVVMAAIVLQYADRPGIAFTIVLLAGVLQILFGVFRVGQYINLMPYPVISGFMTGIGIIIIILQIEPLIGHVNPPGGPLDAILNWGNLATDVNRDAAIVAAITLAIVFLMPRRWSAVVPSPLVALAVGSILVLFLLPGAPILGEVPTGLPALIVPHLTLEALPHVIGSALVLAALGSIDSLLTSLIADNVTGTHHDSNRELIGQGIGNAIAGLIGGLPGAGATMRTVVNVRAGGRTPLSGALHALVLLAVVLGLGPYASHIPHAVLAGILIKVGIDIIDWGYLRRIRRAPREGVFFMLVVLGLTVFVDLIVAVAVGWAMASLLFVKRMADLQIADMNLLDRAENADLPPEEAALFERAEGKVLLFRLHGPFSFGVANALARRVSMLGGHRVIIFDLSDVTMIDSSGSLALESAIRQARARGQVPCIAGLRQNVQATMKRIRALKAVPKSERFSTRREALAFACDLIDRERESAPE